MPQVTLVFTNGVERIISDGDPIFHTAVIRQSLQTNNDDDPNHTIILPQFIEENTFDLLRDHLIHNTYLYQPVGFGKYQGTVLMYSYAHDILYYWLHLVVPATRLLSIIIQVGKCEYCFNGITIHVRGYP